MAAWIPAIISVVGALVGVWLGSRLNVSTAHRTWVVDNKKLEWRELIDAVQEALIIMADAVYGPSGDPSKSVQRVFVLLNNRIFIADTVVSEKLLDRWDQINLYVVSVTVPVYRPNKEAIDSFEIERKAFPRVLIDLSRMDLGIRKA